MKCFKSIWLEIIWLNHLVMFRRFLWFILIMYCDLIVYQLFCSYCKCNFVECIFLNSFFYLILLFSCMINDNKSYSSLQERAKCPVSSQLLEPSLGSGEKRESRPCHYQRSLPQQHHPTLRPGQRGLRTPLQKGDIRLSIPVDFSIKASVVVIELETSFFICLSVQLIIFLSSLTYQILT